MAKLLNPAEPVLFVPEDQRDLDESERISYLLKVPTEWDRINLAKAMASRGARQSGWIGLARAMREILQQAGDTAMLQLVEDFIATGEAYHRADWKGVENGEARQREAFAGLRSAWLDLKPLVDLCASVSPSFASLRGDDAVYVDIVSIEAARIFLRGWSGPGMPPFARGVSGVPLELLQEVAARHPLHLLLVYREVERLLAPSEAEAGNSVSPSPGDGGPTSSTTAPSPTAAVPAT